MLSSLVAGPRFRSISRGLATAPSLSRFGLNSVSSSDVDHFSSILGRGGVVTGDEMSHLNVDWMDKYRGSSSVAVFPRTTQEVSSVLAHCNERRIPVVTQGGNTGLVGGSVPLEDEVLLCTTRMNGICSFDGVSGVVVAEAGCVLERLDEYLRDAGYIMPLDLGAKGSCTIGGNVSTNAGGIRYLRYGSLRGSVVGLEAVLPGGGEVLDLMSTLRKDNTGYDLKQLFIGGEGTLGVVTKVAIQAPIRSSSTSVCLLGAPSFQAVQDALVAAKQRLGEVLSAFEFWDRQSLELLLRQGVKTRDPLGSESPFYVLVETSGSCKDHDAEKLDRYLEHCMEQGVVEDGAVSGSEAQSRDMWGYRENITEALGKAGPVLKYDLSIPVAQMYQLVEHTRQRVGERALVVGYGHMGDANLHLNVSIPPNESVEEIKDMVEPFVYQWTSERRGSISAEHGIGQMKTHMLHLSKSDIAVKYMKQMKSVFDPNNILNPGKVLPIDG